MRRHTKAGAILFAAFVLSGAMRAGLRAQTIPVEAEHTAADSGGITRFHADVRVREDATLDVREEITVNNAARYYKYGFRRDLPITPNERWDTRYVGEYKPDNGVRVDFLEVTEDGAPVSWTQGTGYGYSQIFIGPKNVALDSGEHRFALHYTVTSALTLGTTVGASLRDTLYWNAIGHERNSPVAEAILAVHLPAGVPSGAIDATAHVAGRGVSSPRGPETTLDRIAEPTEPSAIVYRSTNIRPRQSLSVAIVWPSGYVHPPRFEPLRRDAWLFAAPGALFLFYLIAWLRIGREPKSGPVVVAYEPPQGLSAAAMRYIAYSATDGRSFAAVIAHLAVNGCLRVEPENGKYKLSRLMSDRATGATLAPEETRVLRLLFSDGPTIELSPSMEQQNAAKNGLYIGAIHDELNKKLAGKYLNRHIGIILLGVLGTFAIALPLAAMARGRDPFGALFFTVWVLFAGLIIGMIVETSFVSAWKTALRSGRRWVTMLPGTAAIAVFGAAIGYLLRQLAAGVSLTFALMVLALILINLGWAPWLKRKSALGRQVCDQIAGFRQFLLTVEQDRLNRLTDASQTSEDLDQFLPHAIALEVKEAWGDHLAQTFLATTVMVEE